MNPFSTDGMRRHRFGVRLSTNERSLNESFDSFEHSTRKFSHAPRPDIRAKCSFGRIGLVADLRCALHQSRLWAVHVDRHEGRLAAIRCTLHRGRLCGQNGPWKFFTQWRLSQRCISREKHLGWNGDVALRKHMKQNAQKSRRRFHLIVPSNA